MAEIGTDIQKSKALLEQGELVAIPTETVYGLAGNALDSAAVAKIFSAKKRPSFDPIIVHIAAPEHAENYAENIPQQARKLAECFWPGPLTLLLNRKNIIPDLVTAGLSRVGIRCPDHPLTLELLTQLKFPLAAPSANPFGFVSPTKPEHVNDQLGNQVAYILNGGTCKVGIESTIVGFENDEAVIYRLGGISVERIESAIGKVKVQLHSTSNPKTPGQLKSHYAPGKKVMLGDIPSLKAQFANVKVGILAFSSDYHTEHQITLSKTGSLEEAAQNLFAALRAMDKMPVDLILAEPVPDIGLGKAINDRLRRAAAEH